MGSNVENWWKSIPVPCVQELAKDVTAIPSRYIRSDLGGNLLSDDVIEAGSIPPIPIIDLHRLVSEETADSELANLHHACKEWGFFQLVNHGVSVSLMEKLETQVEEWFKLPMEEKKKYWMLPGTIEGFGQAFVMSEDQKLDWGDIFVATTLPIRARSSHLFPTIPIPFRDTLDHYSSEIDRIAKTLVLKIAKALNIKDEEMEELFKERHLRVGMNYYPPCPQPEQAIGISPHSDGSALTILLQANEVDGLQIRKGGKWVPIKAVKNAFIVNIGDFLEIITNGAYRSIEHRATVNSEKERISIATFCRPMIEGGEIGPALSLISPQKPALYRRIPLEEYLRSIAASKLEGKSLINSIKI